jgi:hypothetical protein
VYAEVDECKFKNKGDGSPFHPYYIDSGYKTTEYDVV